MRELTKSLISFSWAMSLFGVKQLANMITPGDPKETTEKAAVAFDSVTHAAEEQLGDTIRPTFKAGDNVQRGMVDLMFNMVTLQQVDPRKIVKMTTDMMQKSAEAVGQTMQSQSGGSQQESPGWGPVS